MAASTRIKANNILFKIGTTDYACDATVVNLELGDATGGGPRTFCDVQAEQQWTLTMDGLASGDALSLYQVLFANYGTEVAFTIAPSGNAIASLTQPHYIGTAIFDMLPPVSLTAGETQAFSVAITVKNTVHTPASKIYWGVTVKTTV